jgi:RHS repeat-associated protein
MCLTRRAVPDFFRDRLLRPGVFSMATRDWSSLVLDSSSFTYDAENKQVKVETLNESGNPIATVGEYHYDGDGKRVKKYVPSTGETTIFVYDASKRLVAEYSTAAEPAATAKTSYLTNDHLGSPRILTDQLGQVISRHDYHPFGEEIARQNYGSDSVRQKFTGYERDDETDLGSAQARVFRFCLRRFESPDPANFGAFGYCPKPGTVMSMY